MSTPCPNYPPTTFVIGNPPTFGGPDPRYMRPVIRVNGMVVDIPVGAVINPCFLPAGMTPVPVQQAGTSVVAAPTAINFTGTGVTVTAVGSVATVDIEGGGGGTGIIVGAAPNLTTSDTAVSLNHFGSNAQYLGTPDAWGKVTLGGTDYVLPLYTAVVEA